MPLIHNYILRKNVADPVFVFDDVKDLTRKMTADDKFWFMR